jgi:hypothetical protein
MMVAVSSLAFALSLHIDKAVNPRARYDVVTIDARA